jgi:diguanylate cyclase (GGDEF)-like protein
VTEHDEIQKALLRKSEARTAGRVLIAEDDGVYRHVLQSLLQRASFETIVVSDGAEALQAARMPDAPRLLILDWVMPGFYGPELCRQLRHCPPSERYQYILLLTSKDSKTDTVEGLEAGADDYLTKPFNPQELLARLRAGTRILELQDRLLETQKELEYQATHDPLTGLWNRLAWKKLLASELQRARRNRTSLSVLMIDVDHFKLVNDTYGHSIGDAVLRELGQSLHSLVRAYDVAGRYGGEEFIIVAQQLSEAGACEYANRIRNALAGITVAGQRALISVTVSVGIAHAEPNRPCVPDAFVLVADHALYAAKAQGRDRVVLEKMSQPAGMYRFGTTDLAEVADAI